MSLKRILFGLWTVLGIVVAKRPFNLIATEISCTRCADPVAELKCHLDNTGNRSVISGFMLLSEEIKSFQIKFTTVYPRPDSEPLTLFDLTADGCKTLDSLGSNNILKIFLTELRKSGHFPKRCPIGANENFTFNNFVVDADMLPSYTPEFSYIADMRYMIGSKVIAKILAKGRVEMKRKRIHLNF